MNKLASAKSLCENYITKIAKKNKGVSWSPQLYNVDTSLMPISDYEQWGTLSDMSMTAALGDSTMPIEDKRKLLKSINFGLYKVPKNEISNGISKNTQYIVHNMEDPRYYSTGTRLLNSGLYGTIGAGVGALGGHLLDNAGIGAAIGGTLGAGLGYAAASGDNWEGREIVKFDGDKPYDQQPVGFINPSKEMQQDSGYGPLFGYKRGQHKEH